MSELRGLSPRPLTARTVIADHAERVRKNPDAFVTTLLRSRSRRGRDIFAHFASGGATLTDELLAAARVGGIRQLSPTANPEMLGRLATVLALQGPRPDIDDALALYSAVWREYGPIAMRTRDVVVYLQTLQRCRSREDVMELAQQAQLDEPTSAALAADLANPHVYPGIENEEGRWLSLLTKALQLDGELMLRDGSENPFDRLNATPSRHIRSAQMITVITSAYNPDGALLNTAKSLIAQSWQNWEMLIVDDASTSGDAKAVLRRVEALDPRIRVIRKAVNGGTYRARNTAMMEARGEFITCLDSDDWAHPDRLLRGVEPMLKSSGVMATRSQGARVSPLLEVTRPGYRTLFPAASSLMFRMSAVAGRIGFFDPVRKGADTEYARRFESAFGVSVLDVAGGALTVLRGDDESLSASEFSFGWRHPVRWAYKQSYGVRHRAIRSRVSEPFVEPDSPPFNFGIDRWSKPDDAQVNLKRQLDVVIAGDWRRYGGPQISMLEEIDALLKDGLRVGILHLEAMRFFTQRDDPLCEPVRELLSSGRVTLVHLDDTVEVDLILLRYPPILQFPPAGRSEIRARRLCIVANQAPAEKDGADQRYVPRDVHRHAQELFGEEPRWVPQSPNIRAVLEPLLDRDVLADWDNPAIIDAEQWWVPRKPVSGGSYTVGRFSRDDVIKFPKSGADLRAAYGFDSSVNVVMMGARSQVRRLLAEDDAGGAVPANWTVLPHKARPVRDFLAQLDAVVYMDHPDAHEAFGRALLESAASGVLVVASPKHRATFGDALVYAEPHQAVAVVQRYLSDPDLLREQLERCRALVRERWSAEAFLGHIRRELTQRSPEPASASGAEVGGAGAVILSRRGARAPEATVEGQSGIEVLTVRVRRFADAERLDYLSVIHAATETNAAQQLARKIVAEHRPGWPAALPADLPTGILGLVWDDGAWSTSLAADCRAHITAQRCTVAWERPEA